MKRAKIILIALILISACAASVHAARQKIDIPGAQSQPQGSDMPPINPFSKKDMLSLKDAFSMDGVAGFVEGRARETIKFALSKQGADWMCDAFADALNARKNGGNGFDLAALFKQDEELKQRVKENIKQRLKEWLPGQVKDVVTNQLLGAALGEEGLEEAKKIADRVVQELNTSLNERIDAIASGFYDSTIDRLKQELSEKGISQWLDVTDLRGSIERALNTGTLTELASGEISRLVGDGVVVGIRGRIEDALNGNLPPEVAQALKAGPEEFEKYINQVQQYLPGNQLQNLTNSVLNKPFIKLPTPAYASMLAASATTHYARAFNGVYVDAYELKRAVEVTRVMVWQIQNKKHISLSLMQLGNLARDIACGLGLGAGFDNIMSQIKKPLERVQDLTDRIDGMLMKPINQVRAELQTLVGQVQQELTALQEQLIAPIRDELENTKGWIQDELDRARWNIEGALPEGFNGIPGSWEDAKEALGLKDGVLGEFGDFKPKDVLGDAADKVKQDLEELNDAISEDLATVASEALEGVHLLGPAAEILDVERVPAQNPSDESALDPVLLHNGEYVQKVTDVVIPGRGIDFRFTRTYRGRSEFLGELGWRWTHSYAERLLPWKDGLTYIDEDGRKFFFQKNATGFISPPGIYAKLVYQRGSGHALYLRDGVVTTFDAHGRPRFKEDRHGNCIQYEYDSKGLLAAVIDVFGRKVRFERQEGGLISKIEDFAGRTILFQYNDAKELIGVTSPSSVDFPKGKETSYRYARDGYGPIHAISMIMDPTGRVWLRLRYDNQGRVIAQRYGDGPWMKVVYADGSGDVAERTWVTDQLGITHLYEHDASGHLLRRWLYNDKAYELLNSYHYNRDGERTLDCLPSGRCTAIKYGSGEMAGLPKEISEIPQNGKKSRTIRIEHEPKYARISRIDLPTGVSERVEYADDRAADPIALYRKISQGCHCERSEAIPWPSGDCFGLCPRNDNWKKIAAYSFNSFGQLMSETDALGVVTEYKYYPANDPDGDGVSIDRNDNVKTGGYLKAIVGDAVDSEQRKAKGAPVKAATSFEYDPMGNIVSSTDPLGRTSKYLVNALNQVLRDENPGLWPIRYSFDANDNLVRVKIERPNHPIEHELEYSALDKLVAKTEQISDGKHAKTRFVYDAAGRLVQIIKPEGNSIEFEYDPEGRIMCVIRGASSLERARECVKRNQDGEVIAHIDGSAVRTEFELNGFGEQVAKKDALGNRTEFARDDAGRINAIKNLDASGKLLAEEHLTYEGELLVQRAQRLWLDDPSKSRWVKTSFEYDEAGNIIGSMDPLGARAKILRDGLGLVVAEIDADGMKQEYVRDKLGRVVESYIESKEHGLSLRALRPSSGQAPQSNLKLDLEVFSYNEAGDLTSFNHGWTKPRQYEYDGQGNFIRIRDPVEGITIFDVDDIGRRTAVNHEGAITKFVWDYNGRLTNATDANGNATEFGYDDLDRLVLERFADGGIKRTQYDGAGRVLSIQGPGRSVTITYDAAGRLALREAHTKEAKGVQRFWHDGMGRLTYAEDGEAISRFVYDSLSRPFAESVGSWWITRGFDDANQVVSLGLPGKDSFFYYYTPAGLLKAVMGKNSRIASFERDELGNIIRQNMAGRIALGLERDDWGREIARQYKSSDGRPVAQWKYELDEAGRVKTEKDSLRDVSRQYVRDAMGQLTGAFEDSNRKWTYELDPVGNILSAKDENGTRQMKYNELNQVIKILGDRHASIEARDDNQFVIARSPALRDDEAIPVQQFQYDSSGNLISDGKWNYEYDAWGRLTSARYGEETIARYSYDAFDRRIEENFADISHEFIWDGWRLAHLDSTEAAQSFVYADGLGAPVASVTSDFPSLFITDRMDSVRGIDGIDNELSARCDYSPYGEEIGCETDQSKYESLFGFAGQIRGADGKLTYMRYRNYDPELMRFITPDPLGYKIVHYYNDESAFGPGLSYHASQGTTSRASIPNRPLSISNAYEAYPYGRFFSGLSARAYQGEMSLYVYAGGDPSTYWDPFGLAKLIFERSTEKMVLEDKNGYVVSIYEVANRTVRPNANPLAEGKYGPFPDGTFSLGVPEFYTKEYRDKFYERFGLGTPKKGESRVSGPYWSRGQGRQGNYSLLQGSIRVRAGAPTSGVDLTAWRRELFIHGGRNNNPIHPTHGCMRARDDELETLAANFIAFRRQGDPVTELIVK
ncbi:MAG: DUF6531 domain-containing protein [Pseudomonadota bacterium]